MKRRGIKDTPDNRTMARSLGYTFTENTKRKRIFIKVTNSDFAVVKELMPDGYEEAH
jgi:hypothetical protein